MNVVNAVQTDVTQKKKSIVRCRAVFHCISALINFSTVVKYKTHFSIIHCASTQAFVCLTHEKSWWRETHLKPFVIFYYIVLHW